MFSPFRLYVYSLTRSKIMSIIFFHFFHKMFLFFSIFVNIFIIHVLELFHEHFLTGRI